MRKAAAALALIMILCASGCNSEMNFGSAPTSSLTISETSAASTVKSTDSNQSAVSFEPAGTENGSDISPDTAAEEEVIEPVISSKPYTRDTRISDVINDPVFDDYGRLIFPVDEGYYSGEALGGLSLTWYNNINPDTTVEIANYMRFHAESGGVIFYDIYSDSEKAGDPLKEDTGLFFFKGEPGGKFAVCSAGGGFAYVGAIAYSEQLSSKHKLNKYKFIGNFVFARRKLRFGERLGNLVGIGRERSRIESARRISRTRTEQHRARIRGVFRSRAKRARISTGACVGGR